LEAPFDTRQDFAAFKKVVAETFERTHILVLACAVLSAQRT
jgi:hypothetical protein